MSTSEKVVQEDRQTDALAVIVRELERLPRGERASVLAAAEMWSALADLPRGERASTIEAVRKRLDGDGVTH